MSIDDERELRQRLGAVLDAVTPRPAPVGAVVRQGRNVMIRRRLSVAAGLAAVAVAAVVVPAWLHRQAAGPRPAAPLVTVTPPGPHAAAGLIASGVVGTRHWRAIAETPTKDNQCFLAGELFCGPRLRPDSPVTFGAGGGTNGLTVQIGAVRPDVARVDLRLADGSVLVLHPVRAYGARLVAFAVPLRIGVARATAYSKRSELAYAIPFDAGGTPSFITWLRPGEPAHLRATYQIGSGTIDGSAWSQAEYVGPWGRCFTGAGQNTDCLFTFGSLLSPGQVTAVTGEPGPGGVAGLYTVAAAPSVQRVRLALADGATISPRVVPAGGQKFYAFGVSQGDRVLHWTAYGSAGQQLGAGTGAGGGDG